MKRSLRLLVFSFFPLFWALSAIPQADGPKGKEGDLYSIALAASIDEMQKSWGHIDDSDNGTSVRTDYSHVIVKQDPRITNGLPTQFGSHRIEYLDVQALIKRYNTLGKKLAVLEISPMVNEGARLKIDVFVSWFSHRHRRAMFELSDWSDVEFQFDCDRQTFVISSVKLGGI